MSLKRKQEYSEYKTDNCFIRDKQRCHLASTQLPIVKNSIATYWPERVPMGTQILVVGV